MKLMLCDFFVRHRHSFTALVVLTISYACCPSTQYQQLFFHPLHISSTSPSFQARLFFWKSMSLFTSKSLSFNEEIPTEIPKFDASFAEAIGRSLKKWTKDEKRQKPPPTSPRKESSSDSSGMSSPIQTDQDSRLVENTVSSSHTTEIKNVQAPEHERLNKQILDEEEEEEIGLHPDFVQYRQEQLEKEWKELQLKVQERIQNRGLLEKITLSKEVKEFEQQILRTQSISESKLKQLQRQEKEYFAKHRSDKPMKELLNLFPEIKALVPKFAKKQDGGLIACQSDEDCPFPLTCCPGFLKTAERFCCSGWGERSLLPSYEYLTLKSDLSPRNGGERGPGRSSSYSPTCPTSLLY